MLAQSFFPRRGVISRLSPFLCPASSNDLASTFINSPVLFFSQRCHIFDSVPLLIVPGEDAAQRGGILHNWRRWEGQYNKSYPSVCYSCKLSAAPFKVFFCSAQLKLNYARQDAKTLYSVCQTRLDCSDGSQMSHKWSKLKSTEPLHRM